MDKPESRILQGLQYDFPLSESPCEVIDNRLQISQAELWQRVQIMPEEGVIRQMGASFDSKKIGFSSTLATGSVVPEPVDRTDEIIGQFPEVTHSYL